MIKIPIYMGHDTQQLVGYAELDETKLPAAPDWHLSLAYYAEWGTHTYTLQSLGIVPEQKFRVTHHELN